MEYLLPTSLSQAEKFKKTIKRSRYFAGGTILNWKGSPKAAALIDLKKLGLSAIKTTSGKTVIGAMTTIQEIADHDQVPEFLKEASRGFTSRNIRNMATIGGNVTGRFYVSDLLPVLAAAKAEVEYFSSGKKKTVPLLKWLEKKKGIVCAVSVKNSSRKVSFKTEKISAIDLPIVVTAAGINLNRGKITDPVISISGARAGLYAAKSASEYLKGLTLPEIDIEKLKSLIQKEIRPTENVKTSARVKRRIIDEHIESIVKEWKGDRS